MGLEEFSFRIIGDFPLLTHNPASMRRSDGGVKTKKIPSVEDEAQAGLYTTDKGHYALPAMAFRSSILNGLKNKKIGKASAISVVQAAVFNSDEWCVLLDPDTMKPAKTFGIDSRRAVVQRQGIIRSRPRFDKWATELTLYVDTSVLDPEQVVEMLNVGGRTVGVGDYRIEKRGPFGRYHAELIQK